MAQGVRLFNLSEVVAFTKEAQIDADGGDAPNQ